jgi:hypothetical protein
MTYCVYVHLIVKLTSKIVKPAKIKSPLFADMENYAPRAGLTAGT